MEMTEMHRRVMAMFTDERRTMSRLELIQTFPLEVAAMQAAVSDLKKHDRLRGYGSTVRVVYGWPESPPTPVIVPALPMVPMVPIVAARPRENTWRAAVRAMPTTDVAASHV